MTTIQAQFLSELKALLRKWQAEIEIMQCLKGDEMFVSFMSQCDDEGKLVREFSEFSLGYWVTYDKDEEVPNKQSLFGDFDDGKLHPSA